MYYIDKDFLGTSHHIVVSPTNVSNVADKPEMTPRENGTTDPGTIGSIARMSKKPVDFIPAEIKSTLRLCDIPIHQAGLSHLMRELEFAELLAEHRQNVRSSLDIVGEYVHTYLKNIQTLNSCEEILLDDLKPGEKNKVIYDTTSTKTGRMKVIEGPNVLTMPKEFKKQIKSRFSNGKIVEIDFSALEPRTALAIAGSSLSLADDIYLELMKKLDLSNREVTKQVIISFLYGAGMRTISNIAGVQQHVLQPKLVELKKIFDYENCIRKIKFEIEKDGFFRNHLGRPLFGTSEKEGTLFNNFCQSSAVDVALSGFSSLLCSIKSEGLNTVSVCFIHDAIILDVPENEIDFLGNISKKLPTYLGVEFPTKLTII